MKHKRLKVTTLAAALALSMSAPVMAGAPAPGSGGGNPPTKDEIAANSDTTVSILQSSVKNPNISYTVPLYVTMAVVANDHSVRTPENYKITNTTPSDDPNDATKQPNIGVTNMSIQKLDKATYETVADVPDSDTAPTHIALTIGGAKMPATPDTKVYPVTLAGSTFVNDGTTTPKAIQGTPLQLDITGKVASIARNDKTAAAQFRIKYTVSLLDQSGQALGAVYAGDDWTAAGLPDWDTTK